MNWKLILESGEVYEFYAATKEEALATRKMYGGTLMQLPAMGAELQPHEEAYYKRSPQKGEAVGGKTYTEEEKAKFAQYLEFVKSPEGKTFPWLKIDDWLAQKDTLWGELERGYSAQQLREYNAWKRYASQYGEMYDFHPTGIEDWLANYEVAQKQLNIWQERAGEPGFVGGVDEYALSPEEAARRREEAYAESRYAAEERYHEQPMYSETFTQWVQGQSDTSQALQAYIKSQYPSLQAEYKAGVGALEGFPTREEARTEAERRESGWQSWLGERMPETTQEYYTQRPAERGERLWMQAPSLRTANW